MDWRAEVFADKEHWEKHPELWHDSCQQSKYDYLERIKKIIL